MTEYGTWDPYAGTEAVLLTVVLLGIGVLLTYLGTRSTTVIGVKRPLVVRDAQSEPGI